MFTKEDIYNTYKQYKEDMKVDFIPEKILILAKHMKETIAGIGIVNSDFFELYIDENNFYYDNSSKEYLQQILYHEFTHVVDRLSFFKNIKNEKEHRRLLFAYTEFHAAKVEMMKRLNLFLSNNSLIHKTSEIQGKFNIITIEEFLNNEHEEFMILHKNLKHNPNIKNVQNIIYAMLYNIGYYFVLNKYNIDNVLPFSLFYDYILDDMEQLKDLLLNETPSEKLCENTSNIALEITKDIAHNYNIL